MKRILLCLMAFSAIISSCTRDHGDMYDPEFVREYYESQWKKQFGEIDPNQTWNVAQGVQANLSIKEDALADYTFNIYTSNPLYDKDAKLMAKTKVTTDAEGYAETSIKFDAPNGLKYFYVMRVNENGRRAVKAIQTSGGVLEATFGNVDVEGESRALVESGDLESTKMTCPYTVDEVNQMIATGKKFSDYPYYVDDFSNGGVFVITGTEQSEGRFPIWCNNSTQLVIANGGVLNLNSSGSIGNMDIIVADGGTLNLISGRHTLNVPSRLIVMPGGLVEDKSTNDATNNDNNNNQNNNEPTTTTITHSYIKVQTQNKAEQEWDTQFFVTWDSNHPLRPGQQWTFSAKIKAAQQSSTYTQTHTSPGSYISFYGVGPNDGVGVGDINFSTEWVTYTASGTVQGANQEGQNSQEGGYTIAFNLNKFTNANTYYFDDISFKLDGVEMIANGDCSDPNNKTNFKTKVYGGSLTDSEFETWTETITVDNNNQNNNNQNNNNSEQYYSLYPMNALIYNAGTMKNIQYLRLASSGTFYNAETGIYTGTEIYQGNDTDILTNWGKMEIVRLGGNLQGTLNNGCLFRATECVEVLFLNQNANTALECCTIKTNFVTLRENSILRAEYYDMGYSPVIKYVGKSESTALITTDVLYSTAGSAVVEGKIYLEANSLGGGNTAWVVEGMTPHLMYGLSKVGESDFAIFPAYKGDDLERSDCTGHGNIPDDYVPPTPENGIKWIIACEDLGSIGDYDFNDIVISVTYVAGGDTAIVEALAAGGTIPANVYVNNELIGEIHGLFGFDDTSKMINTLEEDLENKSIFQGMVKQIKVPTDFSISTADMGKIRIDIINGDGNVKTAIAPTQGGAPQMICVPAPWKWPVEYTSIGAAYPKFGLWGAGYNTGIDWYSTDIATGSVFNLE